MLDLGTDVPAFKIDSLSSAVGLLGNSGFKSFTRTADPAPYKEPFGVWFRGEPTGKTPLVPSIWRQPRNEVSLVYHFVVRAGERGSLCRNSFDWLCLMRHFEMPARVLDWTESLIIALYFAVRDTASTSGSLYVLNARKLNTITRRWPSTHRGIATPWSIETGLRAEFSRTRTRDDYIDQVSSFDRHHAEDAKTLRGLVRQFRTKGDSILRDLATPIAVFPNRLDARMILQQSVFTLHGGVPPDAPRVYDAGHADAGVPRPVHLVELSAGRATEDDFLLHVPVAGTAEIRKDLAYLGIHDGSLFPELDKQARYIDELWGPGSKAPS